MIKLNVTTRQEAFDKSYWGIIGQGVASVVYSGSDALESRCSYRGDNGTKCGIGWLIDDDDYEMRIEGDSVKGLVGEGEIYLIGEIDQDFLERLQGAHDRASNNSIRGEVEFLPEFKRQMVYFAARCNLEMPE